MKKSTSSKLSGEQFWTKLQKIGFSQVGFAKKFGIGPRTVRDWKAGTYPVPLWVEIVLKVMTDNKLKPEDI